ncbi:hypothetical protein M0812_16909 [Anaeramoeba flamelloides]|uniref:Uncharacterized protein n=1 Tax=Anaeramoeba flamelloides TaxID=1746091 RepID=A0AAV7Z6L1_9EUKA|nr:hypothetical protein M0812_16909 [Anaeramoeba flamelloides]
MYYTDNTKALQVYGLYQTKKPILRINRSTTLKGLKEKLLNGYLNSKLFKSVSYKFNLKSYCIRNNEEFEIFKILVWGNASCLSMTRERVNIFVKMVKQQQKNSSVNRIIDNEQIEQENEYEQENFSRKRKFISKRMNNNLHYLKKKKNNRVKEIN